MISRRYQKHSFLGLSTKISRKAQASFDFLATYGWVFIVVLTTIGALTYFGMFDPKRYLPEECEFGQNIVCDDWSIVKSDNTFNMNLKLKNNMEKPIEPVNISLFDYDGDLVSCQGYVYCPFTVSNANWTDPEPDGTFDTPNTQWNLGTSCRIELRNCAKDIIKDTKNYYKITLGFRKATSTHDAPVHIIQGRLFSRAK
ncbi:MAG: hypothetical protein ABH828_02400 [archaeon]